MEIVDDIIKRNYEKMLLTAIAITHSKSDAEDAVQSSFVKLLEKRPKFDSEQHETAWLITVTKNLCKSQLRKKKTAELTDSMLLQAYPAESAEQHELIETVMSLPVKYRAVIHLYYYEGYSTKEIAAITKQRDGTVREQLTRARRMLKKYLLEGEES